MSESNNDLETTLVSPAAPRKRGRPRKTEAEKQAARQSKIEERLQRALEKKVQRQATIESPFSHKLANTAQFNSHTATTNTDIHQRTKHTIDNLVHPHNEPLDKPRLSLRFKNGRSISSSYYDEEEPPAAEIIAIIPDPDNPDVKITVNKKEGEEAPRKRGRPRKIRPENEVPKPKGRPGRPRKVRPEETAQATASTEATEDKAEQNIQQNSPAYLTKEHFEDTAPKFLRSSNKDSLDLDDDDDTEINDLDMIDDIEDNDNEFIDDDLSDYISDKNDLKNQQLQSINVEKIIVPFNPRRFTRIETSINQKTYSSTSSSLEAIGIKPYVFEGEEEYMNDRQLKHIRSILLTQRSTLIKQLEETREVMRENNETYADELDQASVESDYAISLRIRDRERKLTLKIDRALARLDNDPLFGYCEKCGEEIGLRRLEARPTADLCINCKTKAEIHERQQKG